MKVRTPPSLRIFDLILSFPLLKDLIVFTTDKDPDEPLTTALSSTPPMTGSLLVFQGTGIEPLARQLLSLPGGIHFRRLTLKSLREEDLSSATALVEGCSQNLEYLDISCEHLGMSIRHPVCVGVLITYPPF